MGEIFKNIRNQIRKNGDQDVNFEDFKQYFEKYKYIHSKCGENCPHLKRFYARLGLIQAKYKRKILKMKDATISVYDKNDKLPIINNSQQLRKNLSTNYSLVKSEPIGAFNERDAGVGKTALLQKYINNQFPEYYNQTLGCEFHNKQIQLNENTVASLNLWDCGSKLIQNYHTINIYYKVIV
ncbi:phage head-tail family protein, putative [Ichthyophthirius multifiliis]|uniref:Phage head-tail family protein, putative n=1 Tax=Ichthyophthirius multifiliis TaxID=5932 RepID=G0QL55_ICHMU|nr:phage head-tail family protein, putative [Ichthyophthirius multifiliis]EGR34048.1 phage head-tail family protein, putative [Ichthyophthirius multifiliis]|eukprot:XP_004039352.1 phage head-tail family protein, putative [Ichthyophthirius multifiliis]